MKQSSALPLLFHFFILTTATIADGQITVTENNARRFTFRWHSPRPDTSTVEINGTPYSVLSFLQSNSAVSAADGPVRPGYAFTLGIPPDGSPTATVTIDAVTTLSLNHPAVCDKDTAQRFTFSTPWISVPVITRLRSLRTATWTFCPVQVSTDTRSCTFITDGSCTITFPPAVSVNRSTVPSSDYEKMLRHLTANYAVAAQWQTADKLGKKRIAAYPLPPGHRYHTFTVGDGHSGLNEGTINENGMMKITGSRIIGMFGGGLSFDNLRLFASSKSLPDTLPSDGSIPDGIVETALLRCDLNDNGYIDSSDYVIGYVSGTSDWFFRSGSYRFVTNNVTDYRTYWLTAASGSTPGIRHITPIPNNGTDRRTTAFGLQRYLHPSDFIDEISRDMYWETLTRHHPVFSQATGITDADTASPCTLTVTGSSRHNGRSRITYGDIVLDSACDFSFTTSTTLPVPHVVNSPLVFNWAGPSDTAEFMLRSFTFRYRRRLSITDEPAAVTLFPDETDTGNIVSWDLSVATRQKLYIMRIDQDERDIRLVDTITLLQDDVYRITDSSVAGRRYVICNESSLLPLPETTATDAVTAPAASLQITDLRSTSNRTDFLIITHPDFLAAADSLARHKKQMGFKNPVVVNVFDIYRYFSGGNKDVAALRNFIGYVTRYWDKSLYPDYVILFGTGHLDPKAVAHKAIDFIPVYITGSLNFENFFTRVAPQSAAAETAPQIALGRFPCLTNEQAWAMVRKVVETEDPAVADFGEWRNRAVFVADDDMQGNDPDPISRLSSDHVFSSDRTAALLDSIAPSVDLRKVYLYEFEWDQSRRKPGASVALVNEFNNGTGYVNFFGHGADVTWTDEYILTAEMVARMNNHGRYPVVSAFSCSVGRFDLPGDISGLECLSGVLVTSKSAGAVAALSSTRSSGATDNEHLAMNFYAGLFDTSSALSIGDALIAAQVKLGSSAHRTYCILGDPSIRAIRPTRTVNISLDNKSDTLEALQKVTVTGTVTKSDGSIDRDFTGSNAHIAIGLFNAPEMATRKDGGERYVTYQLPGTALFLGKTDVANGTFKQTMLIPQNLTFDEVGPRMTAYAWMDKSTLSATGSKEPIIFHGSQATGTMSDTVGPTISVRPSYDNDNFSGGNASYSDHITVQVPATAEIELFDSSGIDAAGIGPDEGITVEIDGTMPRQNFNSKFQYKEGDFRRGIASVVYDEDVLKPGSYTMTVTARDLIGNLSKKSFGLTVTAYDSLDLDHVINYPNPARYGKQTRFYCNTSYTSQTYWKNDLHLTIKIFTLSGRLLKVIRDARNGEVWDLRDAAGNALSPDIYLWQATAEDYGHHKTKKSKVCKLVIAPPK